MCLISYLTTALAALWLLEKPRNLFHYQVISDATSLSVWKFEAKFLSEVSKANLNLGFERHSKFYMPFYLSLRWKIIWRFCLFYNPSMINVQVC